MTVNVRSDRDFVSLGGCQASGMINLLVFKVVSLVSCADQVFVGMPVNKEICDRFRWQIKRTSTFSAWNYSVHCSTGSSGNRL